MTFAPSVPHPHLLKSRPADSRASNAQMEARRIARLRTKIARFRTTADDLEAVRPAVETLVRNREAAVGSRMLAYSDVGRTIGKSASWVRKAIRGEAVGLRWCEAVNIVRAYEQLCQRIEAAAHNNRLQAEELRRRIDAPGASAGGALAQLDGADPP